MTKPLTRSALLLTLLAVFSAPVAVADERAERAVATRQGALKLMGFYMAPLGGMLRGNLPVDAGRVAAVPITSARWVPC